MEDVLKEKEGFCIKFYLILENCMLIVFCYMIELSYSHYKKENWYINEV